ncbi:MAG TPA: thioredoxin domain-containing protein [Acidimicrobiales bacterium]|nr:thioredoxin domain-containing protein [Acidimicrobiales bacterium]
MPKIRLAKDQISSPYLLSHADNPVDWYTFDDDAFNEAARLDRPIFISIGYSACHWCHVMAHESFEDAPTAAVLNDQFISIKVDREERPDVDAIYMEAVHALGGQGGWPLSVFTTPGGRPFFGGTYFPKVARDQIPAFVGLLDAINSAWHERRESIEEQAAELTDAIKRRLAPPDHLERDRPSADLLVARSVSRVREMFDEEFGGIGNAPKFPQGPMLELLLVADQMGDDRALQMVEKSLAAMASGGIYDHLGGGFARYSVDREWLVPHFEKMLYDQATLARLYLHAYQRTGDERWRQIVTETITYVLRDLRDPNGGINSAEDADSEGEEGRFYTWTREEILSALDDDDASAIFSWYGDMTHANFEHGRSILYRPSRGDIIRPATVEQARQRLFDYRSQRIRPNLDDKVITEWNAMFASALCEAAGTIENASWRQAAIEIGDFILTDLRRDDGRLLRAYRGHRAQHLAMASDYAWSVDLFTRLNEITGRSHYLDVATELAEQLIDLFRAENGGWFLTGRDAIGLVVRPIDSYDGVTPAAGSIATTALLRLGALTGRTRFTEIAGETLRAATAGLIASPVALSHLVLGACIFDHGTMEIVIGPGLEQLVGDVQRQYLPESVLAWGEQTSSPLWEGRNDARAYVCRNGTCQLPAADLDELMTQIDRARAT